MKHILLNEGNVLYTVFFIFLSIIYTYGGAHSDFTLKTHF